LTRSKNLLPFYAVYRGRSSLLSSLAAELERYERDFSPKTKANLVIDVDRDLEKL